MENQRFLSFSVNHFTTEDIEEKHMVPNMKHVQHEVKPMLTHFNYFIWLVLSTPLKNMKVSWDDETPNIWNNNPNVPNHQSVIGFCLKLTSSPMLTLYEVDFDDAEPSRGLRCCCSSIHDRSKSYEVSVSTPKVRCNPTM